MLLAVALFCLSAPPVWTPLAQGVELAAMPFIERPLVGDGLLHVVRIDPARARLEVVVASEEDGVARTAGGWAEAKGFVAVINAGMFEPDGTHVGYLRHDKRVSGHWNAYKSVLAVDAGTSIVVNCQATCPPLSTHDIVVQNLRLIGDRKNVWQENGRRWSEAAIAIDDAGRILFLFSRSPLSMKEWNRGVLGLPLGIVSAMHVEGGPEASLSVRAPGHDLDLAGSWETGFNENDDNHRQWVLPNVIGVVARP